MKIVPAILTNDPADLEVKIRQAEQFTDIAQIDIMDKKFVASTSIKSRDLKKIKTNLYLEVHLMVNSPETYFKRFKEAGAKRIIFHYEANTNNADIEKFIKELREMDISPGIAINPVTPVASVEPFFPKIDMLLLMAVNPGFYGAPFIPKVLDKAREISKMEKNFILSLDGGVKLDNFKEIVSAGIEQIDIGSAIFKGNPRENYKVFLKLL